MHLFYKVNGSTARVGSELTAGAASARDLRAVAALPDFELIYETHFDMVSANAASLRRSRGVPG